MFTPPTYSVEQETYWVIGSLLGNNLLFSELCFRLKENDSNFTFSFKIFALPPLIIIKS